jgi:hypothetical protein
VGDLRILVDCSAEKKKEEEKGLIDKEDFRRTTTRHHSRSARLFPIVRHRQEQHHATHSIFFLYFSSEAFKALITQGFVVSDLVLFVYLVFISHLSNHLNRLLSRREPEREL